MKNRGITLVALIVTIIILLILAGVTISQLTESGLFNKANISKEKATNAEREEQFKLNEYIDAIEQYNGKDLLEMKYSIEGYDEENPPLYGSNLKITVIPEVEGAIVKYSEDGTNYDLDECPTYTNVGAYTLYFKILKEGYKVVEDSKTMQINKAQGGVTAPVALTLTYDGTEKNLVTAGSTETGTIQYKLGEGEYSTAVPKATNVGTYNIYYKVVGNDNYNDVEESMVTSTIQKGENTLTLSSASGSTEYGTPIQITVTENVSGGTLSVESLTTSVATASISGTTITITPQDVSETSAATIRVTSAGTSNYNAKTTDYSITVVHNAPYVLYNSSNGSTSNLRTNFRYSNLFSGYSTCSYSAPTVNSSTVKIKNNSQYFTYSQVETCSVDLTGYNWLDVSFKNQSNTGAYTFVFVYDENATPVRPGDGSRKTATVRTWGDTSDRGTEFSLDVSELTGNKWIAVCVYSGYYDGTGEYTIDNISLR